MTGRHPSLSYSLPEGRGRGWLETRACPHYIRLRIGTRLGLRTSLSICSAMFNPTSALDW